MWMPWCFALEARNFSLPLYTNLSLLKFKEISFLEFDLEGSSLQICLNKNKEKRWIIQRPAVSVVVMETIEIFQISFTSPSFFLQWCVNQIQGNRNFSATWNRSNFNVSENQSDVFRIPIIYNTNETQTHFLFRFIKNEKFSE